MSLVSVKKVPDYEDNLLYAAVCDHFAALGFENDVKHGMRVVIKPNLLAARRPETAVTTHPKLVAAIVKWLKEHDVNDIIIADSPGGLYTAAALKAIYSACGYKSLQDAELNYSTTFTAVSCAPGFKVRFFNIIDPIAQAITSGDCIINVAKLKTHGMTIMSGGMKNLFGVIPGLQKPEMHYRFPDLNDFGGMLAELDKTVSPTVTFIDAVTAMEGDGPSSGTPRQMGLVFASRDVFAQDWYAATLMGLNPADVPMLAQARSKGFITPDEIVVTGDDVSPCSPPFELPETINDELFKFLPKFIQHQVNLVLKRFVRSVPIVDTIHCIGCGKCAESCPPKIIVIKGGKAVFTQRGCISCFCCQEMCPAHVISSKRILKL